MEIQVQLEVGLFSISAQWEGQGEPCGSIEPFLTGDLDICAVVLLQKRAPVFRLDVEGLRTVLGEIFL